MENLKVKTQSLLKRLCVVYMLLFTVLPFETLLNLWNLILMKEVRIKLSPICLPFIPSCRPEQFISENLFKIGIYITNRRFH